MIFSPCRNCDKRHMPKDLCMKDCERLAAVQHFQNTIHTPPYARSDSPDTFNCLHDPTLGLASDEIR